MVTSSRSHNAGRSPASCRGILAWAFMGDVTGAGATWNGHYGRHTMGGRGPVPRPLCVHDSIGTQLLRGE